MTYSIDQLQVDAESNVYTAGWRYTTKDGYYTGIHVYAKPFGSAALDTVTEEVALEWLVDQLSPEYSPENLDDLIAKRKERRDYQASLEVYDVHPGTSPTRASED